jgi:hypothetical protein
LKRKIGGTLSEVPTLLGGSKQGEKGKPDTVQRAKTVRPHWTSPRRHNGFAVARHDMTFHHTDNISALRLWDSKGGARAVFSGLKKSQDNALGFVNFLTAFKFPHTYDSVIAGTVA